SPAPPNPAPQEPERPPSPRAFATATGAVFQAVGSLLMLASCCFWTISSHVIDEATRAQAAATATHWWYYLTGDRLPAAVATIIVATAIIGGAGLLAAGIGLAGEHPNSGRTAMIASGAVAAVMGTCGVILVVHATRLPDPPAALWVSAALPFTLAAVHTVLFLLAGHSATILRDHPPPPDRSTITADQLLDIQNRRRQSR
ncbi:MAG: hypothetical protein ACE5E6_12615, partial [Phycisphaerae bacterium]